MHRPDRSGPVKVIALQGDYHQNEKSDIYPFLQSYCKENKITLRHGAYTGTGWEVQEYGSALASTTADPANLLGLSMARIQSLDSVCCCSKLNLSPVHSCC